VPIGKIFQPLTAEQVRTPIPWNPPLLAYCFAVVPLGVRVVAEGESSSSWASCAFCRRLPGHNVRRILKNVPNRLLGLEAAVWREVCDLLKNPEKLERKFKEGGEAVASVQNAEALKVLRLKQQHALERLIDSFTEGLIEKDQFTSRMARTKDRIAELDAQIQAHSGDIDQLENVRLAAKRLQELSATIGPDLLDADWHRRRDLIRTIVQKVEIGKDNVRIVFRLLPDAGRSGQESIAVTLPR